MASGYSKSAYNSLGYDQVILVDTCFERAQRRALQAKSEIVAPLAYDALEAVEFFKQSDIHIDCLVCLCESRGEGGQTYAMCSDVIMGYMMPLFKKEFLWICNDPSYYYFSGYMNGKAPSLRFPRALKDLYGMNYVSLNLPYKMQEIFADDPDYLPPSLFSNYLTNENQGHVFRMNYSPKTETISLPEGISIRLIQDSIWNHYDELESLFISFKLEYTPMKEYFEQIEKVHYYKQMEFESKLKWANEMGYSHIGFTPHYWYQYDKNYQKQLERFLSTVSRPMTIDFYYLNSWFHLRHIKKAVRTIIRENNNK